MIIGSITAQRAASDLLHQDRLNLTLECNIVEHFILVNLLR